MQFHIFWAWNVRNDEKSNPFLAPTVALQLCSDKLVFHENILAFLKIFFS